MIPTVRIYGSEQDGLAAQREAEEAGFERACLLAPVESAGREREVVQAAVDAECIAGSQLRSCMEALRRGQWVVGIYAPFGRGVEAERLLARHGPVGSVAPPPYHNPTPFSSLFGLPMLSSAKPSTELALIRFVFGEPRLSRNPTPLSSRIGMKPLTASKQKKSSFGLPLLSKNPAPLSSALRVKPLSAARSKSRSFGLRLLLDNPTPLSSFFGMRVLSKKKDDEDRS